MAPLPFHDLVASQPDSGTIMLEMLGSVEHEGSATRKLQKEGICTRSPSRHSRYLAMRTVDRRAWVHLAPLPLTSTWRGKLHCFYAPVHAFVAFSRISLLVYDSRLSRSCLFRCHLEILATLEAGTCRKPNVGILYVRFSRGIFASRSRDFVVCMQHICIHKSLLPDGAVVTHVITCQGRDHIVTIHSGGSILCDSQCPLRTRPDPQEPS